MSILRKKSIDKLLSDYEAGQSDAHGESKLNKVLGVRDLTFMGIAAVIGAGIFSTIGTASFNGGPGVIFLFMITAVTCGFTALCYAEFASRVPVAGSAYTYSYVTFGEIVAWIIGWALILEYAIGNVVVAISWSAYFNNILLATGIHLPDWMTIGYQTALLNYQDALSNHLPTNNLVFTQAPVFLGIRLIFNLPAFVIVILITILAYIGIKESKKSANFMVGLKIVVLVFIAIIGFYLIFTKKTFSNWSPFLPNGMQGVLMSVSSVFFAYIGFDAISTTAEECANPQRDLPRGMLYSLVICTIIYVVTALVITGLVNYKDFNGVADPLAFVFDRIDMPKLGFFISISAVIASTSVMLVFQIGQPRIWMSMSRDGLLPKAFSKISPRYQTPSFATIITGVIVGIPSLLVDDKLMTDLTSIGTLFAFILVCGGVLMLPRLKKEAGKFSIPYINGQFAVPLVTVLFIYLFRERIGLALSNFSSDSYQEVLFLIFVAVLLTVCTASFLKKLSLIPVLGLLSCAYLMIEIPAKSWTVFFIWMLIGLCIYFGYGIRNSKLSNKTLETA